MSDRLRGALQRHHAKPHAKSVLARDDGTDLNSDDVRHGLVRVAKYAGVPVHGPHALRQCFGSRLMLNGAGAHVVLELLGPLPWRENPGQRRCATRIGVSSAGCW